MTIFKRLKYQIEYNQCKRKSEKYMRELKWTMSWQPHDFVHQKVLSDLWYSNERRCCEIEQILKEGLA